MLLATGLCREDEGSALKSSQTIEDRQRISAEWQVLLEAGDGNCGSGRAPHQTLKWRQRSIREGFLEEVMLESTPENIKS